MRRLLALPLLFCAFSPISADPGPGDVFREYLWKGPWENASGWQRVTDPQAAAEGGHAGTSAKRLRLDDHDWIAVPEPAANPSTIRSATSTSPTPLSPCLWNNYQRAKTSLNSLPAPPKLL